MEYLETNPYKEAVQALDMVREQIIRAEEEPSHWKWTLIALHTALQNFMMAALMGKSWLDVMSDDYLKKFQAVMQDPNKEIPDYRIKSFNNLYEAIQSDTMKIREGSKPFVSNEEQDDSVNRLGQMRDNFIHYKPVYYKIAIDIFPLIVKNCIDIIEFLAFESGNINWEENPTFADRTQNLINIIRQEAGYLKKRYPTEDSFLSMAKFT